MARKRMIDPSFWTDEKLGECSANERLLFMGLISNADDSGRGRAGAKLLKATIFPYDDATADDVDGWLIKLASLGMVRLYNVNSQRYFELNNFLKYQTIQKPKTSSIPSFADADPAPEKSENNDDTIQVQYEYDTNTVPVQYEYSLKERKGKGIERKGIEGKEEGKERTEAVAKNVVNALNAKAHVSYLPTAPKILEMVALLLANGHTEEELLAVVGMTCAKWHGTDKQSLLRPSFLFGEHFEELLAGDISAPVSKQKQTAAHSYDARGSTNYDGVFATLADLEGDT